MEKLGQTSPMRLACWDLIGGLFVVAGFVQELVYVLLGNGRPGSDRWTWLVPFVIGMAIMFIAERQLRGEIWTDEELGPLRRLLAHPAWNVLIWIPIVALLIMLSIRRLENHMAVWVFLMLPFQTVMRLQQIVKPKVSAEGLLAGQSFAPMHSEHWGEPR
jgi:hypothetical protein